MVTTMALFLITRGTGFIGSYVVDNLLRHQYNVRIAVRNDVSSKRVLAIHKKYKDQIDSTLVEDIATEGAFDEALKGVEGVVHMASPFKYRIEDSEKDLIVPAVNGTTGILKSTLKFAPEVKRTVLTSSFAAIRGLQPWTVAGTCLR